MKTVGPRCGIKGVGEAVLEGIGRQKSGFGVGFWVVL